MQPTKPAPVAGAGLALLGYGLFSTHDLLVKYLGGFYAPVQILFFSVLLGFPLVALFLVRNPKTGSLWPHHPFWMLLRVLTSYLGTGYAFGAARLHDAFIADPPTRPTHILLSSEEEARKVIEQLDVGSDFAALARSRSIGPSGPRGGDLGYFDPSRMVPEFAEAALELEVGAYSAEPVRTAFGWHVIQLLDHRMEGDHRQAGAGPGDDSSIAIVVPERAP